jgi:peptidylprolyl isomerase
VIEIQPAPAVPENVGKAPDNAETTKSGAKFVVVRPGTGKDKPKPYDNVTFNYTGWDSEGRMFATTEISRTKPAKAPPYRQATGFADVLTNMVAGERVRFWIDASKMQEGGKPVPGLPQGLLCYETEILSFEKGVEPPTTPTDVAKAPDDAKKTAGGVFYKVIKPGKGGPHPKATDTVRVHYSGWTTDGKMFDSSVTRGEPSEFSLQGVIKGWTDGIPVMSVGDKVRFWIPEELAYKGAPGKPAGMLVFDVELLEIKAPGHPDMPPHH